MSGYQEEKDELEGVETISREQATREMQQAVKNVHQQAHQDKGRTTQKNEKKSLAQKDELDGVETISREQAMQEMREAAEKVKSKQKKE